MPGPFYLAFGLCPFNAGLAQPRDDAVISCEILVQWVEFRIGRFQRPLDHDVVGIVVEDYIRPASEETEGVEMALNERWCCRIRRVCYESRPGEANDHREAPQGLPLAVDLDRAEVEPIDLGLFPGLRLEPQLGGYRLVTLYRSEEFLDEGISAVISLRLDFLVQLLGVEGKEL